MTNASAANAINCLGTPKWPRQYMVEILALPTNTQRRKALEDVPEKIRGWVEHLVRDQLNKPSPR